MLEIKGFYTNGDYMGWNGKEWQRYPTEKEYQEDVEIENTFQRLLEVKMRNGKRKEDMICQHSL